MLSNLRTDGEQQARRLPQGDGGSRARGALLAGAGCACTSHRMRGNRPLPLSRKGVKRMKIQHASKKVLVAALSAAMVVAFAPPLP